MQNNCDAMNNMFIYDVSFQTMFFNKFRNELIMTHIENICTFEQSYSYNHFKLCTTLNTIANTIHTVELDESMNKRGPRETRGTLN